MAKKKTSTRKKLNKKRTATPTTFPRRTGNAHPHMEEAARLSAMAAFIRELWVAHNLTQPLFEGDPTPLPSEKTLGRRPSESEYAAMVSLLLEDEARYDQAWSEVVHNREAVAFFLHRGIEPHELAAWVDIQHRTVAATTEPKGGHVHVWRYAEWDSREDWASGADFHTAMYSTDKADIVAIGGFGGHVMYEQVEVPIGSYEHTSALSNAGMSREPK